MKSSTVGDEMTSSPLGEIEELTLCSCCKRQFDEASRPPKLLACKHTFCLACARGVLARGGGGDVGGGGGVRCLHCWERTDPPHGRPDQLPTHAPLLALARRLALATPATLTPAPVPAPTPAPVALWCCACGERGCRAHAYALRPATEAAALLTRERADLLHELDRLAARRRDYLLRALDAATALKLRLEAELAADGEEGNGAPDVTTLAEAAAERERLRARLLDAALQAKLDDVVAAATAPLDERRLRCALREPEFAPPPPPPLARRDPLVFLANHCAAVLCARAGADTDEADTDASGSPTSPGQTSPPASAFPLFYFDLEVNGAAVGRVVIEVRADVAPRMARNFAALATGAAGAGYRGCSVFQCWEGESVITGDFELNNGRGGRSAFEESYFMPDDTRLAAVRGAVGMRRSQRRRDTLGLVGSQFRIVLREMRGFTAIFGGVVAGLALVDRLSRAGDGAGKPVSSIVIADCGKLN